MCSRVMYAERFDEGAVMNMPALFDLAGRVAVVTGGNGGIGRGIALESRRTGAGA
jgi:hypothetical protein